MLLSSDFIRREPLSLHETTSSQPRALSFAPVPYAEALKARLFHDLPNEEGSVPDVGARVADE